MGKHETGFARVEKDFYPTPSWVIATLAEHVDLRDRLIWEPACGSGSMAAALKVAGARVFASDVVDHDYAEIDQIFDFLSDGQPKLTEFARIGGIVTNPPFGPRSKLAEAFIEAGLRRISSDGGFLALLLPADFDSAKTRAEFFADCPHFLAKIVLRKRIIWFERSDGVREAPKENHSWCVWSRAVLRHLQPPVILYAPRQTQ